MNPQKNDNESFEIQERHPVFQVTKLSKYLAMILFIMMPFVGGYIGYVYAPEKVIEVENNQISIANREQVSVSERLQIFSKDSPYFATDGQDLYCLNSIAGEIKAIKLPGVNPAHFKQLSEKYIKDDVKAYRVLCSRPNDSYIYEFEVSDVNSFELVADASESYASKIFQDKNFIYLSLPQEFLMEKYEEIDRNTFQTIGYGKVRTVDLMEGQTTETKNYYFKDKDTVYVIDFGQLKKLDIEPTSFDIDSYEI